MRKVYLRPVALLVLIEVLELGTIIEADFSLTAVLNSWMNASATVVGNLNGLRQFLLCSS